jgi:hypothetical protein
VRVLVAYGKHIDPPIVFAPHNIVLGWSENEVEDLLDQVDTLVGPDAVVYIIDTLSLDQS